MGLLCGTQPAIALGRSTAVGEAQNTKVVIRMTWKLLLRKGRLVVAKSVKILNIGFRCCSVGQFHKFERIAIALAARLLAVSSLNLQVK
ncbi:hypothetical protein BCD67_19665 [Oscillatoriales cyanobacterium USR001]|nr:hypothetical protein BCD67_19665 [Oscillatoriales cyanobacterium USR001]